jgi:hypothetical protein
VPTQTGELAGELAETRTDLEDGRTTPSGDHLELEGTISPLVLVGRLLGVPAGGMTERPDTGFVTHIVSSADQARHYRWWLS